MKIAKKLSIALKSLLSVKLGEIAANEGTLIFDGEGAPEVGTEVFTKDENDEIVPAADGDYTVEDGTVYRVAEGKIAEIIAPAAEEEPAPAISEEEMKFNAHKVEMSASYDEIRRNIQEEINKTGVNGWVVEAAADYAIVNVWTGEKEVYFRYELTTNEDGTVVLGASSEVKPAFVPVEEPQAEPETPAAEEEPVAMADETPAEEPQAEPADEPETEDEPEATVEERLAKAEEFINALRGSLEGILNGVAALEARIEELEVKVAKVDTESAADPIEEPAPEEEEIKSKLSYLRKN